MLSARHRQAADADTRKTGGRRILITKSTKKGMSESVEPEAVVPGQTSGGAMYQWQATVGTGGKGAKSVQKGTENSKLDAGKCAYLRISARKCGFGGNIGTNLLIGPTLRHRECESARGVAQSKTLSRLIDAPMEK